MRRCTSARVALLLLTLLISVTMLPAKSNPIKVPLTYAESDRTLAKSRSEFICGTYRGIEKETPHDFALWKAQAKKLSKAAGVQVTNDFVFDDVQVLEDNGTILRVGDNRFTHDGSSFHFEPNDNNGYSVSEGSLSFDSSLGTNLFLGDDANATRNLLFTFTYYGVDWNAVHINANGMVSFGADVNPTGFFDDTDFFNEFPKIAAYFMDLNPASGAGGVFFKSEGEKATITWNRIPEFDGVNSNTIQLVLRRDSSFDVVFNGIATTSQTNDLPITFGVHPGGNPTLEIISFAEDLPYIGGREASLFEQYQVITTPIVSNVGLIRRFYQTRPDSFFQAIYFTNFTQSLGGAFAYEINISNQIEGIGLPVFDQSDVVGSNGVLESVCNMNQLNSWPTDPELRFFGGGNNFLTIMGQEAGHRWGAFVHFLDENGQESDLILGRADAHWSYFFDSDHSSLEGGNWEPAGGALFEVLTDIDFFSDVDEYILGLRAPEEVTPMFYVSSPSNNQPQNRDNGTPLRGATATGTPVEVTIEDIIAFEGTRIPAEADAPKDLRQAFILVTQNGTTPAQGDLNKVTRFRRAWEDYFEKSVDGRMTLNTSITRTFPVAVIEGHVQDAVSQQPLRNITVRSVEREFDQFVPGGGRYTFRYQAAENSGAAESITIIAGAAGYLADTLTTQIEYGADLTFDFALNPNTTSVEEHDIQIEIPSVFQLEPNFPNPFNPSTTIRYKLPVSSAVELAVFNMRGQKIRTLLSENQGAGVYTVQWDGSNDSGERVASGVYLLSLKAGDFIKTQKMILLK